MFTTSGMYLRISFHYTIMVYGMVLICFINMIDGTFLYSQYFFLKTTYIFQLLPKKYLYQLIEYSSPIRDCIHADAKLVLDI